MDNDKRPADGSLPPGATTIPNAGRPDNAPGLATERAAQAGGPVNRDANAAKALPDLYAKLAAARQALARLKATDPQHVNVISLVANVGGDDLVHEVFDKPALRDVLERDLQARVSDVESKIKALGFEA